MPMVCALRGERLDMAAVMYSRGASLLSVARQFSVSSAAVRNAMSKLGIKIKNKSELADAIRKPLREVIKSKVAIDETTGCWEWRGYVEKNGYGKLTYGKKNMWAHRASYEAFRAKIHAGLEVCHKCDNRRCVNPAHMFIGSRSDNMLDAKAKGRLSSGMKHSIAVVQHARAKAKLNMEKAREIRRLHNDGARTHDIATQFNVDVSTVRLVIRQKIWKDYSWIGLLAN